MAFCGLVYEDRLAGMGFGVQESQEGCVGGIDSVAVRWGKKVGGRMRAHEVG